MSDFKRYDEKRIICSWSLGRRKALVMNDHPNHEAASLSIWFWTMQVLEIANYERCIYVSTRSATILLTTLMQYRPSSEYNTYRSRRCTLQSTTNHKTTSHSLLPSKHTITHGTGAVRQGFDDSTIHNAVLFSSCCLYNHGISILFILTPRVPLPPSKLYCFPDFPRHHLLVPPGSPPDYILFSIPTPPSRF